MPRVFNAYSPADRNGDDEHVAQTSANTGDVKTFTPPACATACFISVETTDARVTFGGDTPDATNGLVFKAAQQPVFIPLGVTIKHVSTAAANSILHVFWME